MYTLKKSLFGGLTFGFLVGSAPCYMAVHRVVTVFGLLRSVDKALYGLYQHAVMFFQLDLSRAKVPWAPFAPRAAAAAH